MTARLILLLMGVALLPRPAAAASMPIEAAAALVAPAVATARPMQGPPWQWVGIGQPAIFSSLWAPVPALATLAPGLRAPWASGPGRVPGLLATLRNNAESVQAGADRISGQAVLNWDRSVVLNAGAYNGP